MQDMLGKIAFIVTASIFVLYCTDLHDPASVCIGRSRISPDYEEQEPFKPVISFHFQGPIILLMEECFKSNNDLLMLPLRQGSLFFLTNLRPKVILHL